MNTSEKLAKVRELVESLVKTAPLQEGQDAADRELQGILRLVGKVEEAKAGSDFASALSAAQAAEKALGGVWEKWLATKGIPGGRRAQNAAGQALSHMSEIVQALRVAKPSLIPDVDPE